MDTEITTSFQEIPASFKNALMSKYRRILDVCECSKNLIIIIYLIENDRILYCSNAFKKLAGKIYTKLIDRGWNYWYSIILDEESVSVKNRLDGFFSAPHPKNTLFLHYHIFNCMNKIVCIDHEIVLKKLGGVTLALNYFSDVSAKERIEQCLPNDENRDFMKGKEENHTPISSREKQVLHLIADGFSSKEIANRLSISNHTATSHRKNLIEKFQVRNTAQLIKKASKVIEL